MKICKKMTKKSLAHVFIIVHGRVQGVYYRAFTETTVKPLGITGYVRNLPQGTVEINAEGNRKSLEKLIGFLQQGPPNSMVTQLEVTWSDYTKCYSNFEIRY